MKIFSALCLAFGVLSSSVFSQALQFSFENVQPVMVGPNPGLYFEVHMTCDSSGTFHSGGNVFIHYNKAAFGDSVLKNGRATVNFMSVVPTATQYTISSVLDFNDSSISVNWLNPFSLGCASPTSVFFTEVPTATPAPICQVTLEYVNSSTAAIIGFDSLRMSGQFTHSPTSPSHCPTLYQSPSNYGPPINTTVLPVSLAYFTGERGGEAISLAWASEKETNLDLFEIERSTDGRTFYSVGKVNGTGYSNGLQDYNYIDENPPLSEMIYRLKQVDLDGRYIYSDSIRVAANASLKPDVTVYPNPTDGLFFFKLEGANADWEDLKVYDKTGKLVYHLSGSSIAEISIDLSSWHSGLYLYRLRLVGGKQLTGRMVKK